MSRLIVVRGAPGSGKTSFAYRAFPGIFHVENDMFHMKDGHYAWYQEKMPGAINWCMDMTRMALSNDMDVVVCNTFTKLRYVMAYEKIANEFGASFHVYRCVGKFKNVHGLSQDMVENFEKSMENYPNETIVNPSDEA